LPEGYSAENVKIGKNDLDFENSRIESSVYADFEVELDQKIVETTIVLTKDSDLSEIPNYFDEKIDFLNLDREDLAIEPFSPKTKYSIDIDAGFVTFGKYNDVYQITRDGRLKKIFNWEDIKDKYEIKPDQMTNLGLEKLQDYRIIRLLRPAGKEDVYYIDDNNEKTHIKNEKEFMEKGLDFEDVWVAEPEEVEKIPYAEN
jgi:hypothetical protein